MTFHEYLQKNAKQIDLEIETFFQDWSKDVEQVSSRLLPLTNTLVDACRGGKRIRGALVVLGYQMALIPNGIASSQISHGASRNDILKVAAAYEIFQAAILVHDDIIDKSPLRRGKPSLYARLGGDHTGKSLATCLGDIGFFLAFRLIADSKFPEKEKNRALSIFSKAMLETGLGELLDVELSMDSWVKPEDDNDGGVMSDIVTVYRFKTAFYTITAPLLLGGVLGGLLEGSLDSIRIFGQNLGIAFQIQDDINDIFSDKKQLGKELGGDIREGKKTLLYAYASEHANKRQREILEKYYGNINIGQKEIGVVKEVLVETEALEYALSEASKYSKKAKESIDGITNNERFQKLFLEMAEYFVNR